MAYLSQFNLPIKNWSAGYHQVDFKLDDRFFGHFEGGMLDNGTFDVTLLANKLSDSIVLFIDYQGTTKTNCDRCLASIHLPINGKTEYLIKFGDEAIDDGTVITINRDKSDWNVASLIWDAINLGKPINHVFECENLVPRPCDENVLNKLNTYLSEEDDSPWGLFSDLHFEQE